MNIGKEGELLVAEYLRKRGWRIVQMNFSRKYGEIDIIALDPGATLVFVEVKTMREGEMKPEDNLTWTKIDKVARISEMFANKHSELIKGDKGWRIDGVTVTLTKSNKYGNICIYPNIINS